MSITTAQIRGARGILDWSQSDLSERTGISATSIGSIENGQSTPRASTLENIRKAFESAGIEFIGLDGVRLRSGDIRKYTGKDGFIEFYDDVYNTVKGTTTDVLVSNVNERAFVNILAEYAQIHVDRINKLETVKYKIIIQEGDNYIPGSVYAEYRWMPKELFASVPFYLYGNKLAIMLFDGQPSIIAMHYTSIAKAYEVQFYDMWKRAKPVEGQNLIEAI